MVFGRMETDPGGLVGGITYTPSKRRRIQRRDVEHEASIGRLNRRARRIQAANRSGGSANARTRISSSR